MELDAKTLQRFWSKVNKDGPVPEHVPHLGECLVWIGGLVSKDPTCSYGSFWITDHVANGIQGKDIAAEYGVSGSCISNNIVKRKTWKHVT